MRLDTTQHMRLEQRMKLAPRMIQAMEILQLPLMALQERVDAELAVNPVLELREGGDGLEPQDDEEAGPPEVRDEQALVVKDNDDQAEDFQRLDSYQREYEPDVWDGEARSARVQSGQRDAKMDAMANTPAPAESLYEHLMEQWSFVETDEPLRRAGALIIERLDEDGYLRERVEDLAESVGGAVPLADLKAALGLVQRLEPTGVAARDLKECLLIQLAARQAAGQDVSLECELVRSFTRDIQMNRLPFIARKTDHTVDQIKQAIERLSHLNPRPGSLIGERGVPVIVPDIIVDLDEDGRPVVRMSRQSSPCLHISRAYRRMAKGRGLNRGAKEFLQNNIRSAQWLIGAIQQRQNTVLRVAQEVFAVQKEFFEHGPAALKPLPMAVVADKVGVHVATVSRAVAGKHAQTPRGIFPLRIFFSGGKTSSEGEDMAWDAIKARLQEVIDAEDKADPLNDDQLVAKLAEAGISIARRTVAKYRKLMDIPPARQRRQF